ncbi:hypothetical protein [Bacillus sp. NMCN6]|uniref:hypothetical protein n=1 Tax=Bacillus sp. NMCN6 TaxID=2108535 RepID=UPI0011587E49|nr:hypothetical protein [Bacillus sp. NMCN6]
MNLPELTLSKGNQSLSDTLVIVHDDPVKAIKHISENFREDLYRLIEFYGETTGLSYVGDTIHSLDVLKKNDVITEQTHAGALSIYTSFMMIDLESDSLKKEFIEGKVIDLQNHSVEILTNIRKEMALKLKDLES